MSNDRWAARHVDAGKPPTTRRDFFKLPFLASTVLQSKPPVRPNVVFILVDDLRWDELSCTGHPFAETPNADRLAKEGASFRNAFVSTPLCSPSRAAFLTGAYSHSNGIIDNVARDALSHRLVTWPRLLHDAGYRTAFLGKWHMGNDDGPRPGFDRWVSFRGQGVYLDAELNIDGRREPSRGYITDVLTAHAIDFLKQPSDKPFCLYLSHKAIHPNTQQRDDGTRANPDQSDAPEAFIPADRHKDAYRGQTPPHRKNYRKPPSDKPALQQRLPGLPPIGPESGTRDAVILARMRTLKAVDDSLGKILTALESRKVLDNTIVIFTSDHGFFYGEHGLGAERRLAYEETIRIPLLVRYPPRFRAASAPGQFVMNIDVAPTVLALAGITPPATIQGRPFWAKPFRKSVCVEYFSDSTYPRIHKMGYDAIRTSQWKFIRYRDIQGANELYDLRADPYELHNRVGDRGTPLRELERDLDSHLRNTASR